MTFDISSIDATATTVDITHPKTGEPIGLSFTLRSEDSPEVRAVKRRHLNETLMLRGKMPSPEKVEARSLDLVVASIEGWDWAEGVNYGGETLEFNPANVRRVLKERPWIKRQIDLVLGDESAFFES